MFAHGVQTCILIDREHVARIPTWIMPKHVFMTHRKPFLMHDFHSMPRVVIQQVSLKSYGGCNSTCDRMMVVSRIDELSAPLDLGH